MGMFQSNGLRVGLITAANLAQALSVFDFRAMADRKHGDLNGDFSLDLGESTHMLHCLNSAHWPCSGWAS